MNEALRSPGDSAVRRRQALLLAGADRLPEAAALIEREVATDEGVAWAVEAIVAAMQRKDLAPAGALADIFARLRHGGRLAGADDGSAGARDSTVRMLSLGKLEHDVEQLRYLRRVGAVGGECDRAIRRIDALAREFGALEPEARRPLCEARDAQIAKVYGRIVHRRDAPRLAHALSGSWDRAAVQRQYLGQRPGVVVVDDFLAPEALDSLRHFALESTVWNGNRYPNGRLGAFFLAGFSCPLLLQIAEEIRDQLPDVIGDHHSLRQLWGFKYPAWLPADSTIHADFAAVNVNFWITPESANNDPETGGMVVYGLDAPPDWDFTTYNERLGIIKSFLDANQAERFYIPYKQNRAIIFNSDLFHATAAVNFDPSYESRRVNITMLYGERGGDQHHPALSVDRTPRLAPPSRQLWKSAGRSRARR